jgi:hypothetical protein
MKYLVGEVTKTWDDGEEPDLTLVSEMFQQLINDQLGNGYRLHSWQLSRVMNGIQSINETIVAVFQKADTEQQS